MPAVELDPQPIPTPAAATSGSPPGQGQPAPPHPRGWRHWLRKWHHRAQVRGLWARIRGGSLTPGRAAWSVAVGLFIGTQPVYGLHLPLVLGTCLPLRLDAAVAYLAANISIPPMIPLILLTSAQIGSRVLHGRFVPLTLDGARQLYAGGFGAMAGAVIVGSLALGAALALCGGAFTYAVGRRLTRRPPPAGPPGAPANVTKCYKMLHF